MKKNDLLPVPTALPTVSADTLTASAAQAVRDILDEAASANTVRSYTSALRYWAAWYHGRFGQPLALPVPDAAVVQFVVDHLVRRSKTGSTWELPAALDGHLVAAGFKQRPGALKLSTIVHRVAVLSAVHRLKKATNPCESVTVRHLLSRARRAAAKRGERPAKKTAITRNAFDALVATCDDSLQGVRDRALLYFAFASGGRRRSEVAEANLSDLKQVGPHDYVYRLERSKTEQAGATATSTPDKPVVGVAGEALATWLARSGLVEGALFRRLWKNRMGPPLSPAAVASVVQKRARLAGLDGHFAGHSLRSGFVTEGGRQGVALAALMAMTNHRSVASVIGYFQAGGVADNPAARLLDAPVRK
ncbi:site-specific integrase [Dyella dinghuensis]|uniref:Site-specific integrase n=1 Tax=Dyella dinghuensis TaxID=1920169 RepID=A0A432LW36_9GAMM|nr:site-specific integrase [Dyella dinghuensis]RUL65779.1 site-specific integrase [Dyella dinghuensis]